MLKEESDKRSILRKPEWLKTKVPIGKSYISVKDIIKHNHLHTICTSGHCPNQYECWNRGTATIMILGDICTRSCKFCNVKTGRPLPVDPQEPERVAQSIKNMNLKHVVLTSVDRDDLEDAGANAWVETIRAIRHVCPETTMETLIGDFDGKEALIQLIVEAAPEIISHNLETVRRITPEVRSRAKYDTSLKVLRIVAENKIIAKSGIMLGLGETQEEIFETLNDLYHTGVSVVTIGQYLQPTRKHLDVKAYIDPQTFKIYEKYGLKLGFRHVESGPLVRSSYHAEKHVS